jgi:hypothetical protein
MRIVSVFLLCFSLLGLAETTAAQKKVALPHGMVYGSKPSTVSLIQASKLDAYLGKRARVSAAIIGTVVRVTKPKGGWFTLDAGNGHTIAAHFKNYNVTLPVELKGRQVIISGTALKEFIADDSQPMSGNRTTDKNSSRKPRLGFEVVGLMVNK